MQVMAGQEGMVQCVEEARLAVTQAEDEAEDLREAVVHLQHERQHLLDRLPGAASVYMLLRDRHAACCSQGDLLHASGQRWMLHL